ncbi:MAG: hypothetical protein ACI843_000304 [Psychrobacter glaciei]|jgi:hypothetical protein
MPGVETNVAQVANLRQDLAQTIGKIETKMGHTVGTDALEDNGRRFTMTGPPMQVTGTVAAQNRQLAPVNYRDGHQELNEPVRDQLLDQLNDRRVSMDSSHPLDEGQELHDRQQLIEKPLTEGETTKFNNLVVEVKNQMELALKHKYGPILGSIVIKLGWASENSAVAKISIQAIHKTLESDSQQAYQLATFQTLLELVSTVNDSGNSSELLGNWGDNSYSHYIRQGKDGDMAKGPKAGSPFDAINIVMGRVNGDLGEDGTGKLSMHTMRDISALTTQMAKQFKPNTVALVKLDNMLAFASGDANKGKNNSALQSMVKELDRNINVSDISNKPYNEQVVEEIIERVQENVHEARVNNGVLSAEMINGINTTYIHFLAHENFGELSQKDLRYPLRGAASWDQNRVMPNDTVRTAIAARGPASWAQNANATYSKVLSADERALAEKLSEAEYPKSGFGPSLTTWNTTQFLDVMLNAGNVQKKVYAAGQGSDWAANNSSKGQKYTEKGAHGLSEPFLTYALSSAGVGENFLVSEEHAETSQQYMRTSLMRAVLKMNMEVTGRVDNQPWTLTTNPKTALG